MKLYLVFFPLAAAAASANAQHPADPAAPAPAVKYESAFADYRPHREEKPAPWREVNDEVGRIGGHVGMFRSSGGRAAPGQPQPPRAKPAQPQSPKP